MVMCLRVFHKNPFFADVNFDEYDKSDDPHDYKFVRWLTKEKVRRKIAVTGPRSIVSDLFIF